VGAAGDTYIVELLELEAVMRAYLFRYAVGRADLEDLLQEAFVRLLALPLEQRSSVRSVRAFALTTARNVAIDWLRQRQVVPIQSIADFGDSYVFDHETRVDESRVDEIVGAHQELQAVERAMARLPRRCRQVFTLRRVYGMSQREIAQTLKISENTVEGQLVKAAKLFTALIQRSQPPKSRAEAARAASDESIVDEARAPSGSKRP
jgi:RNA polymerase sigma factor (sigma-70 family)